VLYANPLLEEVVAGSRHLKKVGGTLQYAVYAAGIIGGDAGPGSRIQVKGLQ